MSTVLRSLIGASVKTNDLRGLHVIVVRLLTSSLISKVDEQFVLLCVRQSHLIQLFSLKLILNYNSNSYTKAEA